MFITVNQEHITLFQENPNDILMVDSIDLLGIDVCWRIATEAPSTWCVVSGSLSHHRPHSHLLNFL